MVGPTFAHQVRVTLTMDVEEAVAGVTVTPQRKRHLKRWVGLIIAACLGWLVGASYGISEGRSRERTDAAMPKLRTPLRSNDAGTSSFVDRARQGPRP